MRTLGSRHPLVLAGSLALTIAFAALSASAAETVPAARKGSGSRWVVPRLPDGRPDFQGNWTNATQTPFERMGNDGPTLTDEQAAALEKRARDVEEYSNQPSDPEDESKKGGIKYDLSAVPGKPTFVEQISQAAGGNVGGYNAFWLDPGHRVMRIDGVARSSIVVDPPNGRIPALTDAGKQRLAQLTAEARQHGASDGPEGRSLSDRCITSFGSNAGPPMLPNYFYNNNYTIVQSQDTVVVMTEMIHDARIIKLSATEHVPPQIRPWFGDSIGHWESDTLVVETTNLHPQQLAQARGMGPFRGGSDKLKVIERFTRTGPDVLLYRFTVEDPATYTAPYSGELAFIRIDEPIYEYACHEGNYALPAILAGAREEERVRQEQQKP